MMSITGADSGTAVQIAVGASIVVAAYIAVEYVYGRESAPSRSVDEDYRVEITGPDKLGISRDGLTIRSLLAPRETAARSSVIAGAYLPQSHNQRGGTEFTWEFFLEFGSTQDNPGTDQVVLLHRGNDVRACPKIIMHRDHSDLSNPSNQLEITFDYVYTGLLSPVRFGDESNHGARLTGENVHKVLRADINKYLTGSKDASDQHRYAHVIVTMRDANWDLPESPSLRNMVRCTVYVNGVGVIDVFCRHHLDDPVVSSLGTHLFPNNGALTLMKPQSESTAMTNLTMSSLVYRNRYMQENECIRVAKDAIKANGINNPDFVFGLGAHTNATLSAKSRNS